MPDTFKILPLLDSQGKSLSHQKLGKNYWQIATADSSEIKVSYRIYANELTVRTNHLDATHGYFNGAAVFFLIRRVGEAADKSRDYPASFRLARYYYATKARRTDKYFYSSRLRYFSRYSCRNRDATGIRV